MYIKAKIKFSHFCLTKNPKNDMFKSIRDFYKYTNGNPHPDRGIHGY
jgi:hypothetical protein